MSVRFFHSGEGPIMIEISVDSQSKVARPAKENDTKLYAPQYRRDIGSPIEKDPPTPEAKAWYKRIFK